MRITSISKSIKNAFKTPSQKRLQSEITDFKKFMNDRNLTMRMENVTVNNEGQMNIGRAILQRKSKLGDAVDLQVDYKQVEKGRSVEPVEAKNVKSLEDAISYIIQKFKGRKIIDTHNSKFDMTI